MKKILAFLMAVTTCFCVFAACGDTEDSDSEKSGSKASDEKEPGNKVSDKDDPDVKDSDKDDPDGKDAESDIYLEAFQRLIDAAAAEDIPATMRATFPDITMDAIENTDSMDAITESMGDISKYGFGTITSTEIVSVEDCDAETIEKLEKLYSVYSNLFIVMDENNISYKDIMAGNIDADQADLIMEPADQLANIISFDSLDVELSVKIEDAKYVTLGYNGMKEKAVAYKVAGEDWKIDTIGIEIIGY